MDSICHQLHQLSSKLPRLNCPFDEKAIPLNGIYILFEKGETAHGTDRIVRIGTHTGNNQLRSRLKQHFLTENKDRSIFRKNIGRCLLNKSEDPFLTQWDWDLTTTKARVTYRKLIDYDKLKQVEHQITQYMQENWLGLYSPKEKIRKSGLWQVNELYKEPLSDKDWEELVHYLCS